MKTNQFNIKRFWQLLCLHFDETKKTNLLILSLTFLAVVAWLVFYIYITPTEGKIHHMFSNLTRNEAIAINATRLPTLILGLFSLIIPCYVFSNISSQSGEIRYLTLPATSAEKWLSRVVYVVVCVVLVYITLNLAILFSSAIGWIFDIKPLKLLTQLNYDSENYVVIETIKMGLFSSMTEMHLMRFITIVFTIATPIFFGTIFRRTPWLYMALILLGIYFILIIGFAFSMMGYFKSHPEVIESIGKLKESLGKEEFIHFATETYISPFVRVMGIVLSILSIVFLWLSYRLFCRRQIACKKIKLIR
ncbi:MAG: hypothetical protein SPL55_04490 [Prevotella sp.]|nr:hypothetical protein [Prevotella sp.]